MDPGGVVRKEYQASIVATRDGRILSGLIVEQTPEAIVLRDAKGQRTRIARSEIEEIKESDVSLMPESLYKEFSPEQLRDLFSFLQNEPSEGERTPMSYRSGRILVHLLRLAEPDGDAPGRRGIERAIYENRLKPIADARPILADFPQFVEPVREVARFEAPILIDDAGADLDVRAWRFSYNARGIIEVPNRLRADRTAVIVVHPWGIDDGQGWRTPEPAGVAFQCTPAKNKIVLDHAATVINPFLKALRSKARIRWHYSLPGIEDPIRKKLYRSFRSQPDGTDRKQGRSELEAKLGSFRYRGQAIPASLTVSSETPTMDYFQQFPGIDAGPILRRPKGFWELPIPVMKSIEVALRDVAIYDGEGYPALRDFLKEQGSPACAADRIQHGYVRLLDDGGLQEPVARLRRVPRRRRDHRHVPGPTHAAVRHESAVCFAALNLFITQASWVRPTRVLRAGVDQAISP